MSRLRVVCLFAAALGFASRDARAAGFSLDTQSARTIGMAAAATGMIDDSSAIFFNPAGIAQGRVVDLQASGTLILPMSTYKDPSGVSTSTPFSVVPTFQAYASGGITDWFSAGVGFFTPYGLTIGWPSGWEGRSLITSASLATYDVNPTIAFRFGPVRFGGGLQLEPATVDLKRDIALPNGVFGSTEMGATAFGIGANAGVQVEAVKNVLSFGAAYRSTVVLNFEGNAHFENIPPALATSIHDQAATSRIVLPDSIAFGVAVRPIPELVIDLDGVYYGWEYMRSIDVRFPNDASGSLSTSQPKRWSDNVNVHLGAELTLQNRWSVRAGAMVDPTPQPADTLTPELPDSTRIAFAVGGGYRHKSGFRVDLGYELILLLPRTSTAPQLPGDYNGYANILSLGLGWTSPKMR